VTDQGIATATITAVAVLLGVVIGRLLESRAGSRRWWRDQRRAAYWQLLSCQQEFFHVTGLGESDRGESPNITTAWLAVQQAVSAVELVAPDNVAKAAKLLGVAVRRNYVVLSALRSGGEVEGVPPAEAAQKASDNVIVARGEFVEVAKKDLMRR